MSQPADQHGMLIVDDDPFIRKLIITTLEGVSHYVMIRHPTERTQCGSLAKSSRGWCSSTSTCRDSMG